MRKITIAVLALVLLFGILLTGYVRTTKSSQEVAIVKPSQQTIVFPTTTEVQHVYVIWGLAAGSFDPKDQSETVSQTEKWLQAAQPVFVQLPPPPNPPITVNANTAPAVLELQLTSNERISISPTFYMTGHSNDLSKLYHFVDGVITYQVGNKTFYFKDPDLYNWLKSNAWQQQFNVK